MNIEKELQDDGIIVTEKIATETVLKITQNISKKITETFPNLNLNEDEIFAKLFSLNMYKAQMPDGMAEASYCYKNSSIYFNSHIQDEDLEEFGVHECIHFLQEIKDKNNKISKMGLSTYLKFNKVVGNGLNEAAVQYISTKIIGIEPSFEKYYGINLFTPSPSYYPLECALLNELIYFTGFDVLFTSTYFSNNDFKNYVIAKTSKATFEKIQSAFDSILKYEEQIIILNNKIADSSNVQKSENKIAEYRENIQSIFIDTQNLIIKEFFNSEYNKITNLEELETCRRKLSNFEPLVATIDDYTFFDDYYLEMMNKLEHKSNILENGGIETAVETRTFSIFTVFKKLKDLILARNVHEK